MGAVVKPAGAGRQLQGCLKAESPVALGRQVSREGQKSKKGKGKIRQYEHGP